MRSIASTCAAAVCCFVAGVAMGADFYAAPNASANGNGSLGSPWKLQTALNHPSAVHPGDTIWLRGGTYAGAFTSKLEGTASNPIIVRQYPGERATLDGGDSNGIAVLLAKGNYTWFWGFEIMSSYPDRSSSQPGPWPTDVERGDGVASGPVPSKGLKFINLIIHDTRQGFSAFSAWSDAEINGCVIYYNGWDGPDNGHGHGIYTQNQTGYKKIVDSVLFHQFSHGIHAYGSDAAFLNNFHVEGNTLFENGDLSTYGQGRNLLLGGSVKINNPKVLNNTMYYPTGAGGTSDFDLGYTSGCTNATVTGNYIATNTYMPSCDPVSMTGNSYYGLETGFTQNQYPSNTYYASRPSGSKVILRPNQYEPGRALITIYNWDLQNSISVDLSSVLDPGTAFQIRNVQDYFGAPVVSAVYSGGTVSVPTANLTVASPIGWSAPPSTGKEFNAYVLIGTPGPDEFFDVLPTNIFHDDVVRVASNDISAGCAPGYYCPAAPVTRAQMAVFLLKSKYGSDYTPPAASGSKFTDVSASAFGAAWIEQLANEGMTSGCGGGKYCPKKSVTRAQMAVLLLKALQGSSYTPPPATGGVFTDVPVNAFAAKWIEDLAERGISSGCGSGKYCPGAIVTRGQMATFLVRTFSLP